MTRASNETGGPIQPERRRFCAGIAGGGLALATGCREQAGGSPRLVPAAELTPAERLYGLAPQRDADVVYQPDVAIVGDGARSIIAMAPDGLTWGIDSGARGMHRVRVGQVLFVTGNCIGRVLGLQRDGDVTAVVLGPVDLTEVFRECRVEFEQPFDPGQASALAAPEFPGAQMSIGPVMAAPWRDDNDATGLDPAAAWWPAPADPAPYWQPAAYNGPQPPAGAPVRYAVNPIQDSNTIGLRMSAWNESVNVLMSAALRLRNASVSFFLDISGARVREARVALNAALQLRMGFDAKAQPTVLTNIKDQSRMVPLDLHMPLMPAIGSAAGGFGLGVSLQHRFLVNTAFSARQSWFHSLGQWDLGGALVMHYVDGGFRPPAELKITHTHKSIMQNMKYVSVGVAGMVLSHEIRLMVGLGAGGFRAGPFLACNNTIGLARGSPLARAVQPNVCRAATLSMWLSPGVGYEIPSIVAEALNFFLRALRMKQIKQSDGIMGRSFQLLKPTTHYLPDNDFCREAAGGAPTTAADS